MAPRFLPALVTLWLQLQGSLATRPLEEKDDIDAALSHQTAGVHSDLTKNFEQVDDAITKVGCCDAFVWGKSARGDCSNGGSVRIIWKKDSRSSGKRTRIRRIQQIRERGNKPKHKEAIKVTRNK